MKQHEITHNERIWYAPALVADPLEQLFSLAYWSSQHRVTGSAQGRGTTWFLHTAALPAALRHYRRGGLWGKLIKDHYWFSGWQQTRSYREFALLNYLQEHGVHVPRPIAARAVKHGWRYQADLLSERIENALDLVDILTKRRLSAEEYQAIGQEIAKMHRLQVNHTDLNIHNILLDKHGKVWLIDFDKCRLEQNAEGWPQGNLTRLRRSFLKEQSKRSILWQPEDFAALLAGYHA